MKGTFNPNQTGQRIFIGCFPTGLVYADRYVEVYRDYKRLAYLNYETLTLTIEKDCPDELRNEICEHSSQYKPGDKLQTAGNCITTLGTKAL